MGAADPPDLATVRRYLQWSVFLLLAMLVILVIDLQLKKAVARQAASAADILWKVRDERAGERVEAPADHGDISNGGADDRVGGTPPGPAGMDGTGGQGAAAPLPAKRRGAGGETGDAP